MAEGQNFRLINIDKRQTLAYLHDSSNLHLDQLLFEYDPARLVWMLAASRIPKPYQRSVEKGHSVHTHDLGALDLPFDVLENIFRQIHHEDAEDAVYLELTNSFLRDIGQKRVYNMLLTYHCPWWLERLICLGEYVRGDDLPLTAGVIKECERAVLCGEMPAEERKAEEARQFREYMACLDDEFGSRDRHFFDGWRLIDSIRKDRGRHNSRIYNCVEYTISDDAGWYTWSNKFRECGTPGLSPTEHRELQALVTPDWSWDGRPETEWVVCSWSCAEYVRVSGVTKLTGASPRGPWTDKDKHLSLGHVLLTQICWSSDASGTNLGYDGPITRGRWAGHHVAIVTVDRLLEDTVFNVKLNGRWDDVTNKVMKEVTEIWMRHDPDVLLAQVRLTDDPSDNERHANENGNDSQS
ncbi:hypothetical protein DAEQUDRAFT_811925 [Daedalea quercina L-15889]|uniref:Uncharacterized protein n=1 Tax=Daedalea quercina L-15889 TaxID=1314783 RepID=A0A165PVF4_9APHY|nr:hypothetical protein DAEQUDRAFT_811925 [Daedalea quercina L-15889]